MLRLGALMIVFAWIITTVLWLAIWIPFYVIGFLVTWIGLVVCGRKAEHMAFPWWFWDSNHGINGTLDYNNLNWIGICNPDVFLAPDPEAAARGIVDRKDGNERKFKNRWIWITWRNPVTNVSMYLLGKRIRKPVTERNWTFGPVILGRVRCGWLWTYSVTIRYPGGNRCFYYAFGWKFLDPSDGRARFLYRISPYRAL